MNYILLKELLLCVLFVVIIIEIKAFISIVHNSKNTIDENEESSNGHNNSLFIVRFIKQNYILNIITVLLIVFIAVIPSEKNTTALYYDMKKNSYSESYEVVYYDKDNIEYHISKDRNILIDTNSQPNEMLLIDKNGYVVDTNNLNVLTTKYPGINYSSSNNSLFFDVYCVYWRPDGTLMYSNNNKCIPVKDMDYYDYVD